MENFTMGHLVILFIAGALLVHFLQASEKSDKGKKDDDKTPEAKKKETGKQKPMATPNGLPGLPVFLEKTDWSKYDEPAYLRKQAARKAKAEKKEEAKPAQSKPSASKQQRTTPRAQMEDFKQNVKNRRAKQGASYEEI